MVKLGDYATVEVNCALGPHDTKDTAHQAMDRPDNDTVIIYRWV